MHFNSILTVIATILTSAVLASVQGSVPDADSALKARDVVTAARKEQGLEPRTNSSENEASELQKRILAADPYTVPYPSQTGLTRYAPLAKKPGTAIATGAPTPQFKASPYKIATAYMKPATVETTLNAPETLSITMMENTAAPAAHP